MKMITVPEWERYSNHNCADYVAQGKTFTYNKLDRLKDMNFDHLDEETPNSQSSPQASVETNSNTDNVVQGNDDDDDYVEFVNNPDAAEMNGEGEVGSLLHQSTQNESPILSNGGTQTDDTTNSNSAAFGTQTDKKSNMSFGTQTDKKSSMSSTQTDRTNMISGQTQTGSGNPMRSIETQTGRIMSDAYAQTNSRNPMKSIETQTSNIMSDVPVQANGPVQVVSEGFKCTTCGKDLASRYSLNRHRKDVHKQKVMSQTEKRIKRLQEKNKNCKISPPSSLSCKPKTPPTSPSKPSKVKSPPPKLPLPPKKVVKDLKKEGAHELFEKAPEDKIKFKKPNMSSGKAATTAGAGVKRSNQSPGCNIKIKKPNKSPGKPTQTAGGKRPNPFINPDSEDEENVEPPKRRQTRSQTNRNKKPQWGGGF